MPNAPVSFTVTCSNNSSIKKWWKRFSFSVLSSTPPFLSRLVSHINNASKTLVKLTKLGPEKRTSLQLALNLQYKGKSDKTHLLKRIFLHREKDQIKHFSPFLYKRPFDHGKEFLKRSQFHLKGFLFRNQELDFRNHTEIRNPSKTYLEPSQRSMTELFCVNN